MALAAESPPNYAQLGPLPGFKVPTLSPEVGTALEGHSSSELPPTAWQTVFCRPLLLRSCPLPSRCRSQEQLPMCPEFAPAGGFMVSLISRMKPQTLGVRVTALKDSTDPNSEP